ncbi:MAG: hypothetical protein FJX23_08825 [Alphaproteobacteria bacterium]|nr:hypothetical protein [Alphaproteobacteria bacterium]
MAYPDQNPQAQDNAPRYSPEYIRWLEDQARNGAANDRSQGYGQQQNQQRPIVKERSPLTKAFSGAVAGAGIATAVTVATGGLALPVVGIAAAAVGLANMVRKGPEGKRTITGDHKRGIFDSTIGNGFRGFLLGAAVTAAITIATGGLALPLALAVGVGVGSINAAAGAARWTGETGRNAVNGVRNSVSGNRRNSPGQERSINLEQKLDRGMGLAESVVALAAGGMTLQGLLSKFTGKGKDKEAKGIAEPEGEKLGFRARRSAEKQERSDMVVAAKDEKGTYVINAQTLADPEFLKGLQERSEELRGSISSKDAVAGSKSITRQAKGVVKFTDAQLANGANLNALVEIAKDVQQETREYTKTVASAEKSHVKAVESAEKSIKAIQKNLERAVGNASFNDPNEISRWSKRLEAAEKGLANLGKEHDKTLDALKADHVERVSGIVKPAEPKAEDFLDKAAKATEKVRETARVKETGAAKPEVAVKPQEQGVASLLQSDKTLQAEVEKRFEKLQDGMGGTAMNADAAKQHKLAIGAQVLKERGDKPAVNVGSAKPAATPPATPQPQNQQNAAKSGGRHRA